MVQNDIQLTTSEAKEIEALRQKINSLELARVAEFRAVEEILKTHNFRHTNLVFGDCVVDFNKDDCVFTVEYKLDEVQYFDCLDTIGLITFITENGEV